MSGGGLYSIRTLESVLDLESSFLTGQGSACSWRRPQQILLFGFKIFKNFVYKFDELYEINVREIVFRKFIEHLAG